MCVPAQQGANESQEQPVRLVTNPYSVVLQAFDYKAEVK